MEFSLLFDETALACELLHPGKRGLDLSRFVISTDRVIVIVIFILQIRPWITFFSLGY